MCRTTAPLRRSSPLQRYSGASRAEAPTPSWRPQRACSSAFAMLACPRARRPLIRGLENQRTRLQPFSRVQGTKKDGSCSHARGHDYCVHSRPSELTN